MKARHVTFWQGVGAFVIVADVGIVLAIILTHTHIDQLVLMLAALPVVGAFALWRPQVVDGWVKRKLGERHD